MPSLFNMRRFSRPGSVHNDRNDRSERGGEQRERDRDRLPHSPPTSYTPPLSHAPMMMPNGTTAASSQHDSHSRPVSVNTSSSFDFANRPPTNYPMTALPSTAVGNLSRTDQIVLRHFWEIKNDENKARDLHFDLLPYCEIYHLVKTSPGAKIISLGSAAGVYIGFELFSGSQLHIDMDDAWHNISHHRVHFRPYETMLKDPAFESIFKTWPKPLTIEFLEEQFVQRWQLDLTSICWESAEVSELGGGGGRGTRMSESSINGDLKDDML